MPRALAIEHLRRTFHDSRQGEIVAVNDVSFHVEPGEFFTLLGPSGCGKTTTLRSVAGLEVPTEGRISIAGEAVYDRAARVTVPPHRRDIGMVFQNYGIWPHMTVFENVALPLRVERPRLSKPLLVARVEEALAVVQLQGLEQRMATALSGGQQQRLSLARALARRPALLLLDEPLSNLDAKLREDMRSELRALQRRIGITTLYVTHDQGEALGMSSRIAVMRGGSIVQEGTPRSIYDRPASVFVAGFVGRANLVEGVLVAGGVEMAIDPGRRYPVDRTTGMADGDRVIVPMRPESISIHALEPTVAPAVRGRMRQAMYVGESVECLVQVNDTELLVLLSPSEIWTHDQEVWVQIPAATHVLPMDDNER